MFKHKTKYKILAIIIVAVLAIGAAIYFSRPTTTTTTDSASAQLLVISSMTYNPAVNNIGDIVGVFGGGHQFSPNETESFAVIRINGITKEQAEAEMNKLLPDSPSSGAEEKNEKTIKPMYQFNISDIADKRIGKAEFLGKIKVNVR